MTPYTYRRPRNCTSGPGHYFCHYAGPRARRNRNPVIKLTVHDTAGDNMRIAYATTHQPPLVLG